MSSRIQNVHSGEYKGKKFRSTLEVRTAEVLDALGIPYEYENRKILLMEGFRSPFQKDKVRSITYIPDFTIGNIMIECKGFETPEWKLKKKLLFKYLQENEPYTVFYQIHDARKSLMEVLDKHLTCLELNIEVTNSPKRKNEKVTTQTFDSISQAMEELNLTGKPMGTILDSLTGKKQYVYGYSWKLKHINYE